MVSKMIHNEGEIMRRFKNGLPTNDNFIEINKYVVKNNIAIPDNII